LIDLIRDNLTHEDMDFLLSVEMGVPDWGKCCAGDLSKYPSVQWKLLNIAKLKANNTTKFNQSIKKLKDFFIRIGYGNGANFP
jgi:hypothetical protein